MWNEQKIAPPEEKWLKKNHYDKNMTRHGLFGNGQSHEIKGRLLGLQNGTRVKRHHFFPTLWMNDLDAKYSIPSATSFDILSKMYFSESSTSCPGLKTTKRKGYLARRWYSLPAQIEPVYTPSYQLCCITSFHWSSSRSTPKSSSYTFYALPASTVVCFFFFSAIGCIQHSRWVSYWCVETNQQAEKSYIRNQEHVRFILPVCLAIRVRVHK